MTQDLPKITKGKDGYNYKYAALEDILELWSPVFDEHDFVLKQSTVAGQGRTVSNGRCHKQDYPYPHGTIRGIKPNPYVFPDYQAVGSGCTYLRRYTLLSVCAQQPVGEDWDGLSADPASKKRPKKKAEKKSEPSPGSKEDASNFMDESGKMSEDPDEPDDFDL